MSKNNAFLFVIIDVEIHFKTKINDIKKTWCFDGFTLEAKLVTSKHLIQVHLEILSRSEENMASHLLTKSITWSKSCQFLHSSESLNRCTCTSCTWLPFVIGQVCSQVWCSPYLPANFGFFELRTFTRSPSKVELGTFYPFTLKVGSKYTYIILEALVWSQRASDTLASLAISWGFLSFHQGLPASLPLLASYWVNASIDSNWWFQ